MTITVRDALKIGGLVEAEVLAGAAGLDSEIRAVDIIDVPDAAIWFRKDSLLSTTFYALKDNIDAQLQILKDIKRCGGAGLIVFSPERYISHIDQRLIDKADELELPLLQMPDCSYIDVIVPVMTRILDKQVQALEYAREVHAMMTNIVLKGKGLSELLSSLTFLLNKPVLMGDADLLLLDAAAPQGMEETSPLLGRWRESGGRNRALKDFYPRGLLKDLVYEKKPSYYRYGSAQADYLDFFFPVVAGEVFFGVLIVTDLDEELSEEKTVAVEAGAMAIALDTIKKRAIREAERKTELEFFNELLLGNIKNRENIISQARRFGLDGSGRYYVILAELSRDSIYDHGQSTRDKGAAKEELENKLYRLLRYALEKENASGAVVQALGSLVAVVRIPDSLDEEAAQQYADGLLLKLHGEVAARMEKVPVFMTGSEFLGDIERISAGYLEAWEALDTGKKLHHKGFALTYSDMAPYLLVKRFLTSSESPKIYERVYGPLLRYDREKGGELARTLETYIACNFSRTKTAVKLHLHRNSLQYRLQKIEELLGVDIDYIDTFPLLLASVSRRLST